MSETVLDAPVVRSRLARVYAEAFLAAAVEQNQADELGAELNDVLRGILRPGSGAAAYFASPVVNRKVKMQVVAEAFAGNASDLLRGLLGVLTKNGRLGELRAIAATYGDLLDTRAGRVRATVTSAVPLTDAQLTTLTQSLAARLGKTPVLVAKVDADLLGGLVVQVGDQVFDTSVRTRLQTLRSQLMDQGTSYVLQNQG